MIKTGNRHWSSLSFLLQFFFISLMSSVSFANVVVQSTVDRNEMAVGDTLNLTVSIISEDSVEGQEPKMPQLDGFKLLNAWTSSSTRLQSTPQGMAFSRQNSFNYSLEAERQGTFTIPPFEVNVDGKIYNTKEIQIVVGPQGSMAQPAIPGGGAAPLDEAEELFNQLLQRRKQAEPNFRSQPKNLNEAFFIQVEVDKTDVYEGEQINVNWYLYVRGALEQLDRLKFPDLRGFWKEDIEPAPALSFQQEVINGVVYKKALLAAHALFPIKPGTSYIDEYKVRCVIRLPTSAFGAFGFGKPYTFTRSSEKVKINVQPLPTDGRPRDFSGAVGEFNVTAQVEGQNLKADQPFVLKIRVDGEGNAKMIDMPPVEWPNTVELYDTKQESKFFKNGRSFKQFEVLLIPRQAGELKIPAISFGMFNPAAGKYTQKSTEPITLQILPSDGAKALPSDRVDSGQVAPVQTPKADVLPDILVNWSPRQRLNPEWRYGLWTFCYLAMFIFLYFNLRRELGWGQKRRSLKAQVEKRFKKVYSALDKENYRQVGTEVTNIVYFTIGEVSGLGGAAVEFNKLMDQAPPSIRRELAEPVSKVLEVFQTLSFAPDSLIERLKDKKMIKKSIKEMEALMYKAVSLSEEAETVLREV